ncbi:MAG TPA: MOSC N-terminal beta barrel domain-containing protein [Actinomycetales bacterium]|nr:MOSC N-terminal beta barrel domain-containing protein [Actinomycetales bacterium]
MTIVSSVRVYPVKSLAGIEVRDAAVEPWGLRGDRRWMVVDSGGEVVTARERHALLSVRATPDDEGGVTLEADGASSLRVAPPTGPADVPVGLSRLDRATSAGAAADAWLSAVLGEPLRLVWLDDPRRRSVSPKHGGQDGDPLSLADAGPLLLTSTASLRQLDAWVREEAERRGEPQPQPLAMLRFRPSVVVEGDLEPFEEDRWQRVRLGGVTYRFAEQCDRCVLTTLDPVTTGGGKEPLRTLARHRRWDGKTWFGIRVIPTSEGRLAVGDDVEVLERSAADDLSAPDVSSAPRARRPA